MDVVRLLGAVLADSPHNRQSMVQISGEHCRWHLSDIAHLLVCLKMSTQTWLFTMRQLGVQ